MITAPSVLGQRDEAAKEGSCEFENFGVRRAKGGGCRPFDLCYTMSHCQRFEIARLLRVLILLLQCRSVKPGQRFLRSVRPSHGSSIHPPKCPGGLALSLLFFVQDKLLLCAVGPLVSSLQLRRSTRLQFEQALQSKGKKNDVQKKTKVLVVVAKGNDWTSNHVIGRVVR